MARTCQYKFSPLTEKNQAMRTEALPTELRQNSDAAQMVPKSVVSSTILCHFNLTMVLGTASKDNTDTYICLYLDCYIATQRGGLQWWGLAPDPQLSPNEGKNPVNWVLDFGSIVIQQLLLNG